LTAGTGLFGNVQKGVISEYFEMLNQCPLYPRKRTFIEHVPMSALCQTETHRTNQSQAWQGIA
jgi:hypothetical protein